MKKIIEKRSISILMEFFPHSLMIWWQRIIAAISDNNVLSSKEKK
jgi:hypothetical protein